MSSQSVYLFWDSPLFYESVSWLLKHPDIKLVGSASNFNSASADIERKRPDTILIEDTGNQPGELVKKYLELFPWTLKIILLSFNDNKLNVYHHEQRTMVQIEDLLQLIRSELR